MEIPLKENVRKGPVLIRDLFLQIYKEKRDAMHNVYDCVHSFSKLLPIQYQIVIGRKNKQVAFRVLFSKEDCFHLMELQYLKDRPDLKQSRAKIFDKLVKQEISIEHIETSDFYSKIRNRIDLLPFLENIFDDNDTIFKYYQKRNVFSMIEADYLLKNNVQGQNIFLFLSEGKDGNYFCRSFFPETNRDYTKNQTVWTLLYKRKKNIISGEDKVLYNILY